jgi:hypothetical protein
MVVSHDEAVKAAAEALARSGYGPGWVLVGDVRMARATERHMVEAEVAVAAAAPVIETDVREKIAVEVLPIASDYRALANYRAIVTGVVIQERVKNSDTLDRIARGSS